MIKDIRSLIASRDTDDARSLHLALTCAESSSAIVMVDLRSKNAFRKSFKPACVILIQFQSLIWLLYYCPRQSRKDFEGFQIVFSSDEDNNLKKVTREVRTSVLPLKQGGNFLPFGRLTMLQYGYLIIATALGESFSYDRLRLVIICNLSEIEISLLSFMSLYIPNRIISNCSDVSDCRVKVTVRILIQKLLLKIGQYLPCLPMKAKRCYPSQWREKMRKSLICLPHDYCKRRGATGVSAEYFLHQWRDSHCHRGGLKTQ